MNVSKPITCHNYLANAQQTLESVALILHLHPTHTSANQHLRHGLRSAAHRPTFTSAQVTGFYFQPCRDDNDEVILEYFRCRCGTVRNKPVATS
ncbi:hypothetical protein GQ600_22123 [Phytophthora cactorum]|nr:hypothetical protein GQ600_22123 [Phytophthora cactorum]